MAIRKAHSVELIERRLRDAETAGAADAMELVGLHDELARLERKWREQIAAGSDRRQPNDIPRLNDYFDRLQRQIDSALRTATIVGIEAKLLIQARDAIAGRSRT